MPAGPPNDASKASPRVTLPNSWWRFLFADVRSGMHFFFGQRIYTIIGRAGNVENAYVFVRFYGKH